MKHLALTESLLSDMKSVCLSEPTGSALLLLQCGIIQSMSKESV
jgi:hypothetical protein